MIANSPPSPLRGPVRFGSAEPLLDPLAGIDVDHIDWLSPAASPAPDIGPSIPYRIRHLRVAPDSVVSYRRRRPVVLDIRASVGRRATVTVVSASWSIDDQPRTGDPLLPGASPAAIRAGLLAADQAEFDTAYAAALAAAREQLDLTELLNCLEHWRRRALLQRDPDDFAAMVRRASQRLTGQPVPDDEPLARTRRRVGM